MNATVSKSDGWVGRRKHFQVQQNNNKTVWVRPHVSTGDHGRAFEWAYHQPHASFWPPKSGGWKDSLENFDQWAASKNCPHGALWCLLKQSGRRVLPWEKVIVSENPQIGNNRSSKIYAVFVKQPDHHCGDDLVCCVWSIYIIMDFV